MGVGRWILAFARFRRWRCGREALTRRLKLSSGAGALAPQTSTERVWREEMEASESSKRRGGGTLLPPSDGAL